MSTAAAGTATTDIYADTFRTVYDAARAAGASKADAADAATQAASHAHLAAHALAPVALAIWFRGRHRWTRDELTHMAAAIQADSVDAALDCWFQHSWRDSGAEFVQMYRDTMEAAIHAARMQSTTTRQETPAP